MGLITSGCQAAFPRLLMQRPHSLLGLARLGLVRLPESQVGLICLWSIGVGEGEMTLMRQGGECTSTRPSVQCRYFSGFQINFELPGKPYDDSRLHGGSI